MALAAFPVYILLDDKTKVLPNFEVKAVKQQDLPKNGNYYLLTSNGWFMHKDMSWADVFVPAEAFPCLAKSRKSIDLKVPKIPSLILAKSHQFFNAVFHKFHGEAELMILFNTKTNVYDLWCPDQRVTHGGVHYDLSDKAAKKGLDNIFIGTIHSHCDFDAFHSGTDVADEVSHDGIHITLGHVNTKTPSVAVSLVVNGIRWTQDITQVADNVSVNKTDRYDFVLNEHDQKELTLNIDKINNEWLPKVSSWRGW